MIKNKLIKLMTQTFFILFYNILRFLPKSSLKKYYCKSTFKIMPNHSLKCHFLFETYYIPCLRQRFPPPPSPLFCSTETLYFFISEEISCLWNSLEIWSQPLSIVNDLHNNVFAVIVLFDITLKSSNFKWHLSS